ncbi:MAG: M3 family metallopeptidase [Tannerella sp.]|nr:M3 family metallopeptidase [Tannerella sp.]
MEKKFIVILLSVFCLNLNAANPLLSKFKTPSGTVPFEKIKTEDFIPAFDESCKAYNEEVKLIVENPLPPTFANTIVALERSGSQLKLVQAIFECLLDGENSERLMEIAKDFSPSISECYHNIYLNNILFERVKAVYAEKDSLNLRTENLRLLEKTYKEFFDRGANLSEADKEKYKKLSTELRLLEIEFRHNKQKDENQFELLLTMPEEIEGLPADVLEIAAQEAKSRDKVGYLFTLADYSYIAFMRFAQNRDLRKKLYMARSNVGNNNNENDNKETLKNIVNMRLEIAQMMGYDNYASYILKDRMAKSEDEVTSFMNGLLDHYKPLAFNEYNRLQGYVFGLENADTIQLMPWDWLYYSEKLKSLQFKIDDEMTRPYFELEKVRQGVFNLATQLYGLTFKENRKIQVYHPDITAYEVYDRRGRFKAVLYTDLLQRPSKLSGSWTSKLQNQYIDVQDVNHRPHIVLVMNFAAPTETIPSLLTYSEVESLLHELGHSLHEILSECTYASLSGTNVEQDFVELPSQIMENWLNEKEFLDRIAAHYETGAKIPAGLVKKLLDATNFNVGYDCVRQVRLSLLDLAWHTITRPFNGDFEEFERKAGLSTAVLPEIPNTLLSTSFEHIFSDDGYAVGYYGYQWAEVLEADAFSVFKKNGIFSVATADNFREFVLSKGDTDAPNNLYIRFRLKEPSIDALLKRNGLTPSIAPGEIVEEEEVGQQIEEPVPEGN